MRHTTCVLAQFEVLIMNAFKTLALTVVVSGLALPAIGFAACSHSTDITNNSNTVLKIVELRSASAAPFFKTQWTGLRTIQPGDTETIQWTSDLNCTDALGTPNHWDVKLYRQNGNVHYCSYMSESQPVELDVPDLCYPQ